MHLSLRRRTRARAGRIGATVIVVATTAATLSTTAATQHHTAPVALRDSGSAVGRTVVPLPSTGVVQFVADPTAKPVQSPQVTQPPKAHKAAPTPRPTPQPTPAPPPPPPPPAREVLGFAPYWTLDTWHQWRMQDLSAIAYFAVTIDGNGNTVTDEGWPSWQSPQLTDMVNAAHAAGVRVLVTVRNFDDGQMFSMLGDQTHFHTAVQTATDLMRMRNLDGVVLDFEGSDPGLAPGFVQYAGQVRASIHAVKPDAQLVVATYAGAASGGGGGMYDVGALAHNADALFVMAYDMATANDPAHATPNAPLSGGRFNDSAVLQQYAAAGAGPDKVILGVPYYGDKWSVSSPDPNAATTDGPAPSTYAQMLDDFGCAQSLTVHQNDPTPWATWYSPPQGDPCGANLGAWREVYFETPATLGAKYDLVNRANLLGTGVWALGFDAGHGELWDTLQAHLTPKR